jgi:hypothetical protein
MFLHHRGVHQDIININDHEFIQLSMENGVHEGRECQQCTTRMASLGTHTNHI